MSTTVKLIWVVTLITFVSACSTYRKVPGALDSSGPSADHVRSSDLKVGDEVRVVLRNDRALKGKILSQSPGKLVIDTGRTGIETLAAEDVRVVEKRVASGGKTALLVFGVIGGTIGLLAVAVAASGGINPYGAK